VTRRVAVLLALLCAVLGLHAPAASAAPKKCPPGQYVDCGVGSDGDTYNGVVIFPGWASGGGASGTGGVSTCEGCVWTYTPACWPNGPDHFSDAMCANAASYCADHGQDGILMKVFLRRPGSGWEQVGTACIGGANDVVTLADLTADAGQVYRDQLRPNAASISPLPANGPWLVNRAAYFAAAGAAPLSGTFGPAGARLTISATPTYVWSWGDGSLPLETASVGGPYPDGDVTHVYTAPGGRTVTLTTRWSATFTVATGFGTFGPYDVPGPPIAPTSTRAIRVQEGRAILVHGAG
jgi:hypothetical protein